MTGWSVDGGGDIVLTAGNDQCMINLEMTMANTSRLAKYSWAVLFYNLFVIVFGAFVRATKSGAGCGSHWPLCNGVVIPRAESVETLIEFTHRVTSGLTIILIGILIIWIWKSYGKGHPVWWSAGLVGLFILTESLIGAWLVLFELVAENASLARAYWMMAHLVNTFLLLGSLGVTSWWLTFGIPAAPLKDTAARVFNLAGIAGMLILGASGAITALGDTLFPSESLLHGLTQDFSPTAPILLRLRIFHPVIAVIVGALNVGFGWWLHNRYQSSLTSKFAAALTALVGVQLVLGVINVILLAPVWMQLVHLFVTTLIWLVVVGLSVFAWIPAYFPASVSRHPIHDVINQTTAG